MKTYLVGGAVRDRLLGRPTKDRDYVVVGATPEAMEAAGFRRVGVDFPVFLHPETHEEYALARTERKRGRGYRGFAVDAAPDVTLEQDLARRDLTINAMAEAADGSLIDPFGGAQDLAQGLLRHVSPAFVEDPLRVLRTARFAARFGFRIASETLDLMRALVAQGEMETLSAERVWAELARALGEEAPQRFIEVLRDCDALAHILPEIDALFGVPQPPEHHPEIDTGVHTLMVLTQASHLSSDPCVRFAALVHDLGKGTTPHNQWPQHAGHEQRGRALVRSLAARLRLPREYADLGALVAEYHLHGHRALELRPQTLLATLEALDVFRRAGRLEQFILACEADFRGRLGFEKRTYPQAAYVRAAAAAARGVDGRAAAEDGLSGPAIAAKIRERRTEAIRNVKLSHGYPA
ncbi:MAG: multifunctional CCA addition/repair protein [Acidiferrobacteraceae bacterium]